MSIQLCFLLSLGSRTSNEANKSTILQAEWIITVHRAVLRLAQMKYRYFGIILPQNSASRTQIFQVHAIETGHISVIYRQTSDILLVGSTGTAAAW